jgi:hypothetical protein
MRSRLLSTVVLMWNFGVYSYLPLKDLHKSEQMKKFEICVGNSVLCCRCTLNCVVDSDSSGEV